MSYTDNPERDAENYFSREESWPKIGICEQCGRPVYRASQYEHGDEYIEIPDGLVHWECWNDYGKMLKKEAV